MNRLRHPGLALQARVEEEDLFTLPDERRNLGRSERAEYVAVLSRRETAELLRDWAKWLRSGGVDEELARKVVSDFPPHVHPRADFVYFISGEATHPIKIGRAWNVPERLGNLQIGSPVKLQCMVAMTGGRLLERALHLLFAHTRSHGEWFHRSPGLLGLIALIRVKLLTPVLTPISESSETVGKNAVSLAPAPGLEVGAASRILGKDRATGGNRRG